MLRKKRIYALYKGDEYIRDGTKQELADYLGVTTKTITFYSSKVQQERYKGNRKIVVYVCTELQDDGE
jgi:NADH:ubiquinone oxidoreductase subunit E